jgi:predicted site-specific integrase-resolvase
MSDLLSIGGVCRELGISLSTADRRIKAGTIVPAFRTSGGHRRFERKSVVPVMQQNDTPLRVVTYARVSSVDQRQDLAVQSEKLRRFVEERYAGGNHLHISDLGSGLNYRKKGLNQLLTLIMAGHIDVLVLNHKDRLLRFGAELVFKLCSFKNVRVEIVETSPVERSFEQELAVDVIELMTVFCARLYGKRSHKNKKIVGGSDSTLQC